MTVAPTKSLSGWNWRGGWWISAPSAHGAVDHGLHVVDMPVGDGAGAAILRDHFAAEIAGELAVHQAELVLVVADAELGVAGAIEIGRNAQELGEPGLGGLVVVRGVGDRAEAAQRRGGHFSSPLVDVRKLRHAPTGFCQHQPKRPWHRRWRRRIAAILAISAIAMSTQLSPHARNVALVVAATLFMQFLDGVIIVTALPRMARDFNVGTLEMSLGVTIYMLAVASCIPAAAWLADRFGAKRVFMVAIALFTLTSIACGAAADLGQFAVARALQGASSSVLFPVGRIIVLRTATKAEIVPAIGLTIWPALFAPVLSPALGGFITEFISWHWNFWINIPLGILGWRWWPPSCPRTPSSPTGRSTRRGSS